jgi:hypothetical protein
MTKQLEKILNLMPTQDYESEEEQITVEDAQKLIEENRDLIAEVDSAISKIDEALPTVRDLDTADQELDELASLAKEKFQDMVDLGMNVDPRFSGPILQTASVLLGHAISAKTAKMDKKLKMINLQLQKAKLDHQIAKDNKKEPGNAPIEGEGIVLDRNDLLKQILGKNTK